MTGGRSAAMPTYEYRCKTCNGHFDVWQKMTDDPLTTCPTCGGPIRRVLFAAGIVFKGGGFYSTDHRAGEAPAAESAAAAKSESTETKPTADAKPAAESKVSTDSKSTTGNKAA